MVVIGGPKDFLGKPAPIGYVAGLGRGAVGFTTRSDIGPARESTMAPAADAQPPQENADDSERYANNENEEGLLGTGPYDKEDEEADEIYAAIDAKMDERRKSRREARERLEMEQNKSTNPSVQELFVDLKHNLSAMSADDWMNIPEPGDMVSAGRKNKKLKENTREFYTQTSDIIIADNRDRSRLSSTVMDTSESGTETSGIATDFRLLNDARQSLLISKLEQVSGDPASVKTAVDPKKYLSDISSVALKSIEEIGDIKRARELLKSVTVTNPKHAPGWITFARVEEIDGKMSQARAIIAKGCEQCPKSEDVWLEAARLNTTQNAKIILANAVRQLPESVKIWLQAMELETETKSKRKVIRKALEFIPGSVKLWKAAIELETDPDDARILLSRAVECVPTSVELWLALARLETYENAKIVINRARKANPSSHEIWIMAARLEESVGNFENIQMLINRIVSSLATQGTNLSREQWTEEAVACEVGNSVQTCHAIVSATISIDVDPKKKKETWLDDIKEVLGRNLVETARAIFSEAIRTFPEDESLWMKASQMEKEHGTKESLESFLKRATSQLPHAVPLWLFFVKEKLQAGEIDDARVILSEAFKQNPDSEELWLSALKLEVENEEYDRARRLLAEARTKSNVPKLWMKSAILERNLKNYSVALDILVDGIKRFNNFPKLWMMKGQVEETLDKSEEARDTFAKAVKACPKSIELWILSSRLEERLGNLTKARATLDKARLLNPKTPALWLEAVRIESRSGNAAVAKSILAKALQECPQSGALWVESIFMEPRPSRKLRSADALKKSDEDPLVVTAVGRLFWMASNMERARSWFNISVNKNPDNGDSWAWLYKFECDQGTEEQREDVLMRCMTAEPRHGEKWCEIAKDPQNWKLKTYQILSLVANALEE